MPQQGIFRGIFQFAGPHLVWLTVWISAVTAVCHLTHWKWITIPWLLTVRDTAVAFYIGFKNNQTYDRLWEEAKYGVV